MAMGLWGRSSVSFLCSLWLLAATVVAFLYLGWLRTPHFGPSLRIYLLIVAVLLFLLPHVVLALMCLGRRRAFSRGFVWAVLLIVVVEVYAQAQEWTFKARHRDLPPSAESVTEQRWWPFHWHSLIYVPATGEWLAGC